MPKIEVDQKEEPKKIYPTEEEQKLMHRRLIQEALVDGIYLLSDKEQENLFKKILKRSKEAKVESPKIKEGIYIDATFYKVAQWLSSIKIDGKDVETMVYGRMKINTNKKGIESIYIFDPYIPDQECYSSYVTSTYDGTDAAVKYFKEHILDEIKMVAPEDQPLVLQRRMSTELRYYHHCHPSSDTTPSSTDKEEWFKHACLEYPPFGIFSIASKGGDKISFYTVTPKLDGYDVTKIEKPVKIIGAVDWSHVQKVLKDWHKKLSTADITKVVQVDNYHTVSYFGHTYSGSSTYFHSANKNTKVGKTSGTNKKGQTIQAEISDKYFDEDNGLLEI